MQRLTQRMLLRGQQPTLLTHTWMRYLETYWKPEDIQQGDIRKWYLNMLKYLCNMSEKDLLEDYRKMKDISSKRAIMYGEPSGGQQQNECGWLVVNWIRRYYKQNMLTRDEMHTIGGMCVQGRSQKIQQRKESSS